MRKKNVRRLRSNELRTALFKHEQLPDGCPRRGDRAVFIRDHHNDETGLEVSVVNDPHYGDIYCPRCQTKISDWCVEVKADDPRFPPEKGPYFAPVSWLRKINQLSIRGHKLETL